MIKPATIEPVLPELSAALASHPGAVLEAPPGTGKSTIAPLALLHESWLRDRRLVMLEPRRIAARAVASRMADTLGERVGETVGYRTRLDSRVGPRTRLEVITEGILTRQLQHDPALEGAGLVIFDEFHERSLQADLGLALVRDVQKHLRPDLKLLVMSATLASADVGAMLRVPVVRWEGRAFPVETHYATTDPGDALEAAVARAVARGLERHPGDVLVFLPGAGEIRRVAHRLTSAGLPASVHVHPLYGELAPAAQDQALRPAPAGGRKVVLATNVAETSLTIPGVQVVIDSGLERRPQYDPRTGLSRLATVRISRSSAAQRRGRAGRTGPGICYRLWTEARHRTLADHGAPEIATADLTSVALELACWGATDPRALTWLDPPAPGALAAARGLLTSLGALHPDGRVTPHGRHMADLAAHPRLAHMLLRSRGTGHAGSACLLAALLGERDVLRNAGDADIRLRLEALRDGARAAPGIDTAAALRVRRSAALLARSLRVRLEDSSEDCPEDRPGTAGALLALAYPDRVGRNRADGSRRFQLSNGHGAWFAEPQPLAGAPYIVVPALDAGTRDARIFLAAPVTLPELEAGLPERLSTVEDVRWDGRERAVVARRSRCLGELRLTETTMKGAPDAVMAALLTGIRQLGLDVLPWDREARQWQARVLFLRRHGPGTWPDVSDENLLTGLAQWLAPYLAGCSRADHLARVDLRSALQGLLDRQQSRRLDELAPAQVTVPSGSRLSIDYLDGDIPTLSVRLQEVFGLKATPRLADGRVPLLMKLLSPARRPVQVTRDLESFWAGTYAEVRRELKGRYPKHNWPEDPHIAVPHSGVRPR